MRDRGCCDCCSSASVRSDCGAHWSRDGTIDHLALDGAHGRRLTDDLSRCASRQEGARHEGEQDRCQRRRGTSTFGACRLVSEVRVKGRSAMLAKALLGARSQLLSMSLALENQIRGILKTFGRIVPKGAGG